MRVIRKDINDFNRLIIGERHYFLASINKKNYLVSGSCKHRGGPLFIGDLSLCKKKIVCPWHSKQTSLKQLLSESLPFVRLGNKLEIVVDNSDSIQFSKVMVSDMSEAIFPR